ncbi:RNA polymerase sigma factor [Ekhidna sp.]|uniref:RNA polymerase sigma factor n=1 Tax=Ekhidna sp. TaxID=2608089 RepID=UPI003B512176
MFFTKHINKTDEELMVLIKKRDNQAFSILYSRYADRLCAFFYRMLWADREMAEDFVHDLFSKIINKPDQYNEAYPLKPWLFRIASNMCKNAYRKKNFENAYREMYQEETSYEESHDLSLDEVVLTDQVHELLDQMEEERKLIFLLRYQQELPIQTIAEMLDISEGTIKSRLFYTREKIKTSLKY